MAVTRQNLIDRLNAMRAATPANPIKKSDFAQFLEDWLNYMTNDGAYSAGVLEQWKTETLALQNDKLNADITLANNAAAQALASAAMASLVAQGQATARPLVSANTMNFAQAKALPSGLQFARNTVATYVDARGIIRTTKANVCRFTHDPETGESLGILVEESRTNYSKNSNGPIIDTSTKFTIIGNTTAPDGSNDAIIFEKKNTANLNFVYDSGVEMLQNGIYTRSVFVKKITSDECILIFEGVGGTVGSGGIINFNLDTKNFSGDISSPLEYGFERYPNGWLRVWVSIEKSATKIINSSFYLGGYGNSSASLNRIAVWGHQFEDGKYASSIIKTSGAIFTRAADIPIYKNNQHKSFTIVASGIKTKGWEKVNQYNNILGTTTGIALMGLPPGMNYTQLYDGAVSLKTPTLQNGFLKDNFFNIAASVSLEENLQRIVLNGGAISSNTTSVGSSSLFGDIYIGNRNGIANYLNGTIKAITIYPRNLSDVEMQEITNNRLSGTSPKSLPTNNDLGSAAFLDIASVLSYKNRQEFSVDCTGASITRNIRRPYPFLFEITDSSGVSVTTQPSVSCVENTDNSLVFTGPAGKTLTYAITPVFEY